MYEQCTTGKTTQCSVIYAGLGAFLTQIFFLPVHGNGYNNCIHLHLLPCCSTYTFIKYIAVRTVCDEAYQPHGGWGVVIK